MKRIRLVTGIAAVAIASLALLPVVSSVGTSRAGATGAASIYCVGAAKADITPDLVHMQPFYLGGYGIGPVHQATTVLRQIYSRAMAIGIPDSNGSCSGANPHDQVVIAADDLQGHFIAYSNGAYGFYDMARDLHSALKIPISNILIQTTHTHNGPDDLGIWGGVPTSYLQEVKTGTEAAISNAFRSEEPATITWSNIDMTGFSGTFGPNTDATNTGDNKDYPMDNTLRVLQATSVATSSSPAHVVATMVNYSSHATVYGPLNKVAPDWPGSTATYLEDDQAGAPGPTGYQNSVAVVTVGAVGHTWPASVPSSKQAPATTVPSPTSDNYGADYFGDAVAYQAIKALSDTSTAQQLSGAADVEAASSPLEVTNDNPILLATFAPVPGYHVLRAYTPPWGAVDVLFTETQMLRVGNLALMSVPGEPYPSIESTMSSEVAGRATGSAAVVFPFGLADDQLGYVEEPGDYPGAMQCSTTDEGFFTISPTFGHDLEVVQRSNASRVGFTVSDPGPPADLGLGDVPPSTACSQQQLQAIESDPVGFLTGQLP